MASGFRDSSQECITEGRGAQAAVAAEDYSPHALVGKVGSASLSQLVDEIIAKIAINDSPNIIFAENVWIDLHPLYPVL